MNFLFIRRVGSAGCFFFPIWRGISLVAWRGRGGGVFRDEGGKRILSKT